MNAVWSSDQNKYRKLEVKTKKFRLTLICEYIELCIAYWWDDTMIIRKLRSGYSNDSLTFWYIWKNEWN